MKTFHQSSLFLVLALTAVVYAFHVAERAIADEWVQGHAEVGPVLSSPPGIYAQPFLLRLSPRDPAGEVSYAIGSQDFQRYAAPIMIAGDVALRARETRPSGQVAERAAHYQIGSPLELAPEGVTLWYNQPSAVRFRGKHDRSYFVWLAGTAVTICYFDHAHKRFSPPFVIDRMPALNDHAAPSLQIVPQGRNAGRILVFYGMPNQRLTVRRSAIPEEIQAWDPAQTPIDGRLFYPNPVYLGSGRLAVFFSRNADPSDRLPLTHRVFGFATSVDDGETWSKPQTLVDFGDGYWIYAAPVSMIEGKITLAWSQYSFRRNTFSGIFLVQSTDGGENWALSNGHRLTLPIDRRAAVDLLGDRFRDTNIRVWDVRRTRGGTMLTFVRYSSTRAANYFGSLPDDSLRLHAWRIAPTTAGYYPGGAILGISSQLTVLASVLRNGTGEIEAWCSPDDGASWVSFFRITQRSAHDQVRPQVVQEDLDRARVTWLNSTRYDTYFSYRASLQTLALRTPENPCAPPGG